MARTIMAVCVVCILCAHRVPCQQHFDDIFPTASILVQNDKLSSRDSGGGGGSSSSSYGQAVYNDPGSLPQHAQLIYQPLNAKVFQPAAASSHSVNSPESHSSYYSSDSRKHSRHKRHADHGHQHGPPASVQPEITEEFLQRLFQQHGQSDGKISMKSFRNILNQLGLYELMATEETWSSSGGGSSKEVSTTSGESSSSKNDTCISDTKLVQHIQPHDLSHHHTHDHEDHELEHHQDEHDSNHTHHDAHGSNYSLSTQDFLHICPILLYQLTASTSRERSGCIQSNLLAKIDEIEANASDKMVYVWMYAFASVFACSILGLVGVAIIPFMNTRFYKHILQYFVALAVGTMTGDALLHLLPHSLAGQTETNMIFKGLTCMGGIIFFYITEHGLTMISEWRKRIAKTEPQPAAGAKIMRDPDSSINNSVAGDKLCKSKYSSYPYCYDEIAMDSKNDVWLHKPNNIATGDDVVMHGNKRNGKVEADSSGTAGQSLLSTSHNNYAPIAEMNHHSHHHHHHHHHGHNHNHNNHNDHQHDSIMTTNDLDGNAMGDGVAIGATSPNALTNGNSKSEKPTPPVGEPITVILREHESSHHGHSHKHGHVHSPPESLSAVVWMIIMGDGLHNFTDGMAIGAAFADNLAGGFSTSLAVFCHELPHELGDFAILIKAGMSVKSAVYYNLLTGVLSFVGMIFGIVFGQSQEAAQWMFAAAAGLFIYIALVDMMPEMSSTHKSLEQFALQVLGMTTGVGIMLLIAIYEGDLMRVFDSSA